ncbi:MAG: magnesium transporter [Clostridia bacterium]|nr:magnesium transporter [Clostridia bacterium]
MEEKNINIGLFDEDEIITPERLSQLLVDKKYAEVKLHVQDLPAPDLAELFSELDERYHSLLFRLLSKELAAETFVEMDSDLQHALITRFTDRELSDILDELYIDDTVDIIEEMPANVVKRILKNSDSEDRAIINRILRYPKDSAGTVMTTEYVRFTGDMTVADALLHIRRVAIDKETIYTCYVTGKDKRLLGIVTAKDLLISDPDIPLTEIMDENVIAVHTHDDKEEVAMKLDKYGFLAIPVVDSESRLVGIVTVDDALEVIIEESEEDFAKMAAITSASDTPYLKTDVFSIWKSRIPWLLILMLSSTLSSAILGSFESALPAVLVLFIPMIMGTGGNSGGQSSVTVTRSISLAEIEFSDLFKVFWKELRVGILCAITLGVATFAKVMLIDGLLLGNTAVTLSVSLTVALSLSLTIILAKIIGAILPLLAKKIGLDPAVMASPLITTLVDAISLIVYFAVASDILNL